MKRSRSRHWWAAAAIAILFVAGVALWQWQTLARLAIVATAASVAQVRVSFAGMALGRDRAVFDDVRITSFRDEPIAEIPRLRVAYDLRDLLPGGTRLFGLKAVEAESPHVTIIRRPDGTFNVPTTPLEPKPSERQSPLIVSARVVHGSIEVVDQRPRAAARGAHLYVANLDADAALSQTRSRYSVSMAYGERPNLLYPVRGRGDINPSEGYIDQRWTAARLPIASAVNFLADSPSLRFLGGMLHDADVRYVALRDAGGALTPHLAGSAALFSGRISITGLAKPIDDIRGPLDVYDDGLLTQGFDAELARVPVHISGGIYGLHDPRLRLAVRGSGEAANLRPAFTQAARIPMSGALSFALLVEGATAKPVTWIALRSPRVKYASTSVDDLTGLVAFDGHEADVIGLQGAYQRLQLSARGRVKLVRAPGAVDLLLDVRSPPGGVPYVGALLPQIPLNAVALATADDPKAIALQGAVWGKSGTQRLDALFNVDHRGQGSVGPLRVDTSRGSLYARVALDRPSDVNFGVVTARSFALPYAHAIVDGTAIGAQTNAGTEAAVAGRIASPWAAVNARGNVALTNGELRGGFFGDAGREGSFGATIAGTPSAPRIAGTVVVAGGRYRDFDVNGNAVLAYAGGSLRVRDTAVAVGPLFVGIAGTIDGLSPQGSFAPRYDLDAGLHTSEVSTLVATMQPRAASLVGGSIDADMHVWGTPSAPSVAGAFRAPEGSVNGLAFRNLRGVFRGDAGDVSVQRGQVVVGETALAFHGERLGDRTSIALNAPRADLADFNDFFDAGDTFAGTGSAALQATLRGTHVVATSGDTRLSSARFRRLELGTVAAHWRTSGNTVATAVSLGGSTGRLALSGNVTPATLSLNVRATAHQIDLGAWLPMLGINAPVTGLLDAQTSLSGRYPDIAMQLHAAIFGGTAGRLTIERFEVSAATAHGRGTVTSAALDLPSLTTTATGTFGLRQSDPIALVAHSTSPDVGAFLLHATGKDVQVGGTLDSTLRLEGTRIAPRVRDTITLASLRYGNLTLPRVAGEVDADRHAVHLQNGEVDFASGRALASATVPVKVSSSRFTIADAPISASLRADGVELSNFAALLPKGSTTSGRIDGEIVARGTLSAPQFGGSLRLRGGTLSGPIERTPITGIVADLTLTKSAAQLESHAAVGGGTLSAAGTVALASLRRLADAGVNARLTAAKARLDMPEYFQGLLDGEVSLVRAPSSTPQISGNVAVSNARIPLNAFLNQKSGGETRPALPNVAFNGVRIAAGQNVRVQSRNVDIGATGEVALRGTLQAPALSGSFRSTGGSLNFYRNFNLESGTVRFEPSSGIVPDINAVATTYVSDPATAIRLHVTGPATNMNLALASDPAYSREQILGLLVGVQQFGAVRGVRSVNGQPFSAGSAAANVALGQLNTAFSRNLLEPLSSSLAGSLGFNEVRITSDIQTGVGVSAVKAFGKNVNAIFAQTFGYPKTQSITLEAHPNVGTGLRLTAFTSTGPTVLGLSQPQPIGVDVMNLNPLTALTAVSGTNGITFSYQRKFP